MAIFCAAGVAVAAWLAATAAVVYAAIAAAIAAIIVAVTAIAIYVASLVAGTVLGVIQGLGLISFAQMASALELIGLANLTAVTTALAVAEYITITISFFQSFAEIIHLKTLLQVHEIAYIVSDNYRIFMNKVYLNIGEFSNAIGIGFGFFPLALRNVRAIILDASTTLGKPYDVAEVTWLFGLSEFMETIADKGDEYARNPHHIFNDLDRILTKPAMDAKAFAMQTLFVVIEQGLTATKKVIEGVSLVSADLDRFIADLPDFVRGQWSEALLGVTADFNDFYREDYRPAIDTLDGVLKVVNKRIDDARLIAFRIISRLKYPGDLLEGVDNLLSFERDKQVGKISQIANEPSRLLSEAVIQSSQSGYDTLKSLAEALGLKIPEVAWDVGELPGLSAPVFGQVPDTKTWFVGEF